MTEVDTRADEGSREVTDTLWYYYCDSDIDYLAETYLGAYNSATYLYSTF